jgi:transposase
MATEDTICMTQREVKRLQVIQGVIEGRVRQRQAATMLDVSPRQIRRLVRRVEAQGAAGLCHRSRGRPSNRRMAPRRKARVLKLFQTRYADFGPTFACEKLAERHQITVSDETLRGWLKAAAIPYPSRKPRPHRHWRARRAHRGELVQMDGSHHAWLEDRGPACVLMAYIDDASSDVLARFYEYEGTVPAFDSFGRYVARYGVPHAVYPDRHSTYQAQATPTREDDLAGRKAMTQFERGLHELGVTVIPAHSPQAKGRVERLFRTFQDRLIKELRLARIATREAANTFLEGYLPRYNARFAVVPAEAADLHRPCPDAETVAQALCVKTSRTVRQDGTIVYQRQWYQLDEPRRPKTVVVEERLDGRRRLTANGQRLRAHALPAPPAPASPPPRRAPRPRPARQPAPDHPWRREAAFAAKLGPRRSST